MAGVPASSRGGSSSSSPGYELDYAQATTNVTITATSEGTATTIVTGAAVTYDGATVVLVECFLPVMEPKNTASTQTFVPVLYDGSSSIGLLSQTTTQVGAINENVPLYAARRITPSAAAHTYSLRAFASVANALARCGTGVSGDYQPAFIRITRV